MVKKWMGMNWTRYQRQKRMEKTEEGESCKKKKRLEEGSTGISGM